MMRAALVVCSSRYEGRNASSRRSRGNAGDLDRLPTAGILQDGLYGTLVPPHDARAMARAISARSTPRSIDGALMRAGSTTPPQGREFVSDATAGL